VSLSISLLLFFLSPHISWPKSITFLVEMVVCVCMCQPNLTLTFIRRVNVLEINCLQRDVVSTHLPH